MDFTTSTEMRSLALVIEDRKLWVSREILASWSPVFKAMFYEDFKEAKACEIPLPDKRYDDMLELIQVLSPPVLKPVDWDNVALLLEFSREYLIDALKERCRQILEQTLQSKEKTERYFDVLILALKYEFHELIELSIPKVARLSSQYIHKRRKELPLNVALALADAKFSRLKNHSIHAAAKQCGYCHRINQSCSKCSSSRTSQICSRCNNALCQNCFQRNDCTMNHDQCDCEVDCEFDKTVLRQADGKGEQDHTAERTE